MDRATADRLVAEFGARLGVPELALDDTGTCTFAVGAGAMLPTIGFNARTGSIDLMICLDEVVPAPDQLGQLLAANFAWLGSAGACFAIEPGSGALVLQRRCTAGDLAEGLYPLLAGLVAAAEYWGALLAGATPPEPEAEMGEIRGSLLGMMRA